MRPCYPWQRKNYVAFDQSLRVCHFLSCITDSSQAQTKLSLNANCEKYSGDFDVIVEYLMTQVLHQKVNEHLDIVSIGSSSPKTLKTNYDKGQELYMPVIYYLHEQWAHFSSAQSTEGQFFCIGH